MVETFRRVGVVGAERLKPSDQAYDGVISPILGLGPRAGDGLNEPMNRHRRRAILEGVMFHKRKFGERRERPRALSLVVDRALDEGQGDALRRAVRKKRHQRFGRRTLRRRVVNREIEGRGDAARIRRAARGRGDEARRLRRVFGEAHLRPPASRCRMVERQRQPPQRLRKRPRAHFVPASGAMHEKCNGFRDRQHVERDKLCSFKCCRWRGRWAF